MKLTLPLHPQQRKAYRSIATEILFGGAAGGGKALALDTPIPTPDGWKDMAELCSGDRVFDENGLPCNVVAATDVMRGRPCYRITFSDGSEMVADSSHQWLTMDNKEREQARRLTPEFREKRRATRAPRCHLKSLVRISIGNCLRCVTDFFQPQKYRILCE